MLEAAVQVHTKIYTQKIALNIEYRGEEGGDR